MEFISTLYLLDTEHNFFRLSFMEISFSGILT